MTKSDIEFLSKKCVSQYADTLRRFDCKETNEMAEIVVGIVNDDAQWRKWEQLSSIASNRKILGYMIDAVVDVLVRLTREENHRSRQFEAVRAFEKELQARRANF
jgi:hypothetical protein